MGNPRSITAWAPVLGACLFLAGSVASAQTVAVSPGELVCDWLLQDVGTDIAGCFESRQDAGRESAAVRAVLEELGEDAGALRTEFDALRAAGATGDDPRWRVLYDEACSRRRRVRLAPLRARWPRVVFTRHYDLGGSHYAYTENLTDAQYEERGRHDSAWRVGAALCLLEVGEDGATTVRTLLEDPDGVIRDPAVSWDGKRILFAWRQSADEDDYHLYEMAAETGEVRQLTRGIGFADYEGAYLPSGDIVFNSTRCVQTVDCWWTEVSNLYTCDPDGAHLRRLTFDQVHDNYPQVLDDGRVVYTRWEYSDRGQVYPQPLFQMNPDGTGQTELYGNNSWFPTSILHARGIPGTNKLVGVLSGHHSHQRGKLAVIDPTRGRQEASGVQLVAPVRATPAERVDSYGQGGAQFQYPYALDETRYLVTFAPDSGGNRRYRRPYGLYFMDDAGRRELLAWDPELSSNQAVPLAPRPKPHVRASLVDHDAATATCYVHDVHLGPGLEGVPRGTIERLRVVALEFRAAGIGQNRLQGPAGGALACTPIATGNGSWDVKRVLGETPVHADGSVMFQVPARTPLYFQLLDGDRHVVQTMRSWTTLQPGESVSCQGCHEDKNTAAPARRASLAMRVGPRPLEPFLDPTRGFSYPRDVQPILDRHCVACHHLEGDGATDVAKKESDAFSLRGTPVRDATSKRIWSTSYLVLTKSTVDPGGAQGWPNDLVSWISAQSVPPMLPPYHAGAARSGLFALLEAGHHDVALAPEELDVLACWIDLLVPFCGDYREAAAWTEAEHAKYERFLDKRQRAEDEERASRSR